MANSSTVGARRPAKTIDPVLVAIANVREARTRFKRIEDELRAFDRQTGFGRLEKKMVRAFDSYQDAQLTALNTAFTTNKGAVALFAFLAAQAKRGVWSKEELAPAMQRLQADIMNQAEEG